MDDKILITESDIEKARKFRAMINALPLDKVKFQTLEGKIITFPKDAIEDFQSTGLNNMDFYLTKFWKTKKPKSLNSKK